MATIILVRHGENDWSKANKLAGWLPGVHLNETGHRQAEAAWRQSEERMRRFSEVTEEGLVFHQNGSITDVNAAALRMTGYSLAELEAMTFADLTYPEDLPDSLALRDRVLTGDIESY